MGPSTMCSGVPFPSCLWNSHVLFGQTERAQTRRRRTVAVDDLILAPLTPSLIMSAFKTNINVVFILSRTTRLSGR